MPIHASVAGWFTAEVAEEGELIAVVSPNFAKLHLLFIFPFFFPWSYLIGFESSVLRYKNLFPRLETLIGQCGGGEWYYLLFLRL